MKINTKQEAKKEIAELVSSFEKGITTFTGSDYKEAQVENDFIRPLFQSLNWNVSNRGLEPEKQIFQLQVTGKTGRDNNKRPDYLVRVPDKNSNSMKSVFFIEAKKPKYDLKTNETYIRQVYQYAYSTLNSSDNPNNQVRLAILTDFQEFRFFDCQDVAPLKQNRAEGFNKHVIKDWTYKDYIEKFDELWDLLEYNNVVNGSLDKWHITSKQLADSRITPDKQFLEDLREWRLAIARSMYKNDKNLDDYKLTKATLLYINRIIFVKMLADRNIEDDYLTDILNKLSQSKKSELKLYELCHDIFKRLDHIYNGSMFAYDNITDEIIIDNSVLQKIFTNLKPENSIYTLAAMPVEIIGNVYELFIAEQISKKGSGIAIIPKYDEKKAGGVYYTPRYIVEYIVNNTLGKKLEECKTPEDVAKIKVLDPACGSGSFLIVAYQKLIDWHKKYYFDELLKWTKKDNVDKFRNKNEKKIRAISDANSDYYQIHLSHKLKSDILTNNIFGVDIDDQAVLVTKFSLSIKAMEDSTHDEVLEDNDIFRTPAIPKLENNIKCGNSLIGSDFYIDNRPSLFNEKEKRKINTFDWEKEFPEVFKDNRKNPEKVIINKIDTHINAAVNYLEGAIYHTEKAEEYVEDLMKFVVKESTPAYNAGSKGGFDVIIGNPPWVDLKGHPPDLTKYYFKYFKTAKNRINLYALIIEKAIDLKNRNACLGFIIPNSILYQSSYNILRKKILQSSGINKIVRLPDNTFNGVKAESLVLIIGIQDSKCECIIYDRKDTINDINIKQALEHKLISTLAWLNDKDTTFDIFSNEKILMVLKKIENIQSKLIEFCDFSLGITPYDKYKGHSEKQIIERVFHSTYQINNTFKPLLEGSDVKRYFLNWSGNEFISYGKWLGAPRDKRFFIEPRILIRQIISGIPPKIFSSYTENEYYNTQTIFNIILKQKALPNKSVSLKYILGLFNSTLINFYHNYKFLDKSKNLFQKILIQNAKQFPIYTIDFSNRSEKAKHDKLVELVEQMLENQKYLHEANGESDKKLYQNICDSLDKQIDRLVYKLYDLNEEEIAVVEDNENL